MAGVLAWFSPCAAAAPGAPGADVVDSTLASLDVLVAALGEEGPDAPSQQEVAERVLALGIELRGSFAAPDSGEVANADLERLLDALYWLARFSVNSGLRPEQESELLSALLEVAEALDVRRALKAEDADRVAQVLLQARRFEQAEHWLRARPESAHRPVPARTGEAADGLAYWRLDANGDLAPHLLEPSREGILVVVTAPHCPFARMAAEVLVDDDDLAARSLWLFPPFRTSFEDMRGWNRRFPRLQIGLLHRREHWAALPVVHSSPSIYLVREGEVRTLSTGWDDDTLDVILAAMREGAH